MAAEFVSDCREQLECITSFATRETSRVKCIIVDDKRHALFNCFDRCPLTFTGICNPGLEFCEIDAVVVEALLDHFH